MVVGDNTRCLRGGQTGSQRAARISIHNPLSGISLWMENAAYVPPRQGIREGGHTEDRESVVDMQQEDEEHAS